MAKQGGTHDGHSHTIAAPPARCPHQTNLPVVILTGYLGAGKTTLLNYILNEQRDKKLAVIENEIGEVSVDDALVEQKHDTAEELIVLNNGCICCTIRGDLQKSLEDLSERIVNDGVELDGVLVELTGAADPAPVVQTFMMTPSLRRSFYVDNVITLVDAKHCLQKLDESEANPKEQGTACAQIAFSSTVLLNKVDLVEEATIAECEKRIKEVNSAVDIIRCEQARVPLERLFNVRAFDLAAVLEEQYMDEEEFMQFYKPKMDRSISNVGVKFEGGLNMFLFQQFLTSLVGEEESAMDFLRIKGVFHIQGNNRMFVLQCVHMLRNQCFTKPWGDATRENRIIFIGRGMQQRRQELTEGIMSCIAQPLRFEVGSRVQAKIDDYNYVPGQVVACWDELNAYRIRLDEGGECHAPMDDDCFVIAG